MNRTSRDAPWHRRRRVGPPWRSVNTKCGLAAAAMMAGLLGSRTAKAHFYLEAPANWVSSNPRDGTPEKAGPCGNEAATLPDGGASRPSGRVTNFSLNADGTAAVTLTIQEVVFHQGWYRVALVAGRSDSQTVTSLPDPPTPANRTMPNHTCTATIVSPPVLPVVADGILKHTSPFAKPQTVTITVPAGVKCTEANPCTLQVIEVMDDTMHSPPGCFYHHCADIALGNISQPPGDGSVDAPSGEASASGNATDAAAGNGATESDATESDTLERDAAPESSLRATADATGGPPPSGTRTGDPDATLAATSGAVDSPSEPQTPSSGGCAVAAEGAPSASALALIAVFVATRSRRKRHA